jgi:hypothetical protein
MSEPRLLVITVAPDLEGRLSDWLIDLDPPIGFSSTVVNGHGLALENFTLAEQVRGSRRRVQFQVQTEAGQAERILDALGEEFPAADMHFWMIPLVAIAPRLPR